MPPTRTAPQLRLTVRTDQAVLYFQTMPPTAVPREGDDVYLTCDPSVVGDGTGWWRVVKVTWAFPSMRAMTPTTEAVVSVEWSPVNPGPPPTYDEDRGGWIRGEITLAQPQACR